MMKYKYSVVLLFSFMFFSCSPEVEDTPLFYYPLYCDGETRLSTQNDGGWQIDIEEFKVVVSQLQFTIEGETHASVLKKINDWVIPSAYAHPGHEAGGEVTGELQGNFIFDFTNGKQEKVGDASLLKGDYNGFNFSFIKATQTLFPNANEQLLKSSAYIRGTAQRDGTSLSFEAIIQHDDNSRMIGGVYSHSIARENEGYLLLQVVPTSIENTSLFDGIEFDELDVNSNGTVQIQSGDAPHNILKKQLQKHDFWKIVLIDKESL